MPLEGKDGWGSSAPEISGVFVDVGDVGVFSLDLSVNSEASDECNISDRRFEARKKHFETNLGITSEMTSGITSINPSPLLGPRCWQGPKSRARSLGEHRLESFSAGFFQKVDFLDWGRSGNASPVRASAVLITLMQLVMCAGEKAWCRSRCQSLFGRPQTPRGDGVVHLSIACRYRVRWYCFVSFVFKRNAAVSIRVFQNPKRYLEFNANMRAPKTALYLKDPPPIFTIQAMFPMYCACTCGCTMPVPSPIMPPWRRTSRPAVHARSLWVATSRASRGSLCLHGVWDDTGGDKKEVERTCQQEMWLEMWTWPSCPIEEKNMWNLKSLPDC